MFTPSISRTRIYRTLALGMALLLLGGCASAPKPRTYTVGGEVFDLTGLPERRADVVVAALSQMGTPYVFGGTTPGRALDCSGLTSYAHNRAGLHIPRHSMDQKAAARPLRGRPKPGDLVFFQTGPRDYHVGLMVDQQRFVHASTGKRRVQLTRFDADYWQQRFLGAGTFLE